MENFSRVESHFFNFTTALLSILSLFLLFYFNFFFSHIFTFSLLSLWWCLLHLAKLSSKQHQNFQIWDQLAQANKTKTLHEIISSLRSEISTQSPAVFLPFLFFKGGVCFLGKFKKDFWFGHDHESASQREKKILCVRSASSRPRQSTVAPPNRDPRRSSSRPRPMSSPLQAETHAAAPPDRDPPVGFDENGREKRKKKMEERERRREGEQREKMGQMKGKWRKKKRLK